MKTAREWRKERNRELWGGGGLDAMGGWLSDDFILAIQRDALEAAAEAVCVGCPDSRIVHESHFWVHPAVPEIQGGPDVRMKCRASEIHDLIAELGK